MKITVFSRGQGWGHSVRDVILSRIIQHECSGVSFVFSSSRDGIQGYFHMGIADVIDYRESDEVMEEIVLKEKPSLIIADELLGPLKIAMKAGIPSVFITNYMISELYYEITRYTDYILFANFEDLWPIDCPKEKVYFSGPVFARHKMEEEQSKHDTTVIPVYFSGSEDIKVQLENILLIKKLSMITNYHFVITQPKYRRFFEGLDHNNIIWDTAYKSDYQICICRGGLTTLCENVYQGIYSICVPYSEYINPMESMTAVYFQKRGLCACYKVNELSCDSIRSAIDRYMTEKKEFSDKAHDFMIDNGNQNAVSYLMTIIDILVGREDRT